MTIRAAPIARGARSPAVATAMPMVKTRKKVPTDSTASLRSMGIAAPWLRLTRSGVPGEGRPSSLPQPFRCPRRHPWRKKASKVRTSGRLCVLAVSLAAFLGLAPAAMAGTVSFDGPTLVFTGGDNSSHDVQVRYNQSTGRDEVLDNQPITSFPPECQYEGLNSWISCQPHSQLRVDLGGGNDGVTTGGSQGDCFDVYTFNLGNGANDTAMNDACDTPATATQTAGSGQDTLRGGR